MYWGYSRFASSSKIAVEQRCCIRVGNAIIDNIFSLPLTPDCVIARKFTPTSTKLVKKKLAESALRVSMIFREKMTKYS